MRNRLCYAWFGELADLLTSDTGSRGRSEFPLLPQPKRRAVISPDKRVGTITSAEAPEPSPRSRDAD